MTLTEMVSPDQAIPEDLARRLRVVGLRWDEEGSLVVGCPEDFDDAQLTSIAEEVQRLVSAPVTPVRVEAEELVEALDASYRTLGDFTARVTAGAEVSEGPIAELVTSIMDRAVRLRASDVHFEPGQDEFVVRVRIDGKLEDLARFPNTVAAPVVSRLKVLAQMNIVERRRPQDGQFGLRLMDKDIDIRMATIATLYGEKAVARLLDTGRNLDDVEQLGMKGQYLETFNKLIQSHYGMLVVVGPTGAGKTTTLHSAIRELNTSDRNVATLEDPVEYVVDGVNHIPVVESIGVGFATQLRGLLRQDPDIILVGEMRDEETARIGIQAALAGRLVLTSFHATDAVAAIYRLLQMGIEPHLVAASLRGVVAQRLLRRVCRYCKVEYEASVAEKVLLQHVAEGSGKLTVAKGLGCTICRGTGYRGRIGVFQILEITDELRELISKRPNPTELYGAASRGGLRTLGDEAYLAALAKETSVMEASQLVGSDV